MSATLLKQSARQLNTALPRLTLRNATQRPFSILERSRMISRTVEPLPSESIGVFQTAAHAKADWGRQFRHLGDASMIFFPAIALFLGWPLVAEKIVDGHMH